MDFKSKEHGYLFIDFDEITDEWIAISEKGDELTAGDFSEDELQEIDGHLNEMRYDSNIIDCYEHLNYKGSKE